MPRVCQGRAVWWFQFSIGDARSGAEQYCAIPFKIVFQFSIGDAEYTIGLGTLPDRQFRIQFQFSIGDAFMPASYKYVAKALDVSILYWRCRFLDDLNVVAVDLDVSILYWRCYPIEVVAQALRVFELKFQFSIGDAAQRWARS